MKGKMFIISILACVLLFATVSGAGAYCGKYGKVVQVYMNGTNATTATIYVAPLSFFPTYYYYFTTSNSRYIDIASDAMGDNSTIYFLGNVSSCPTSGTFRYVGTATKFVAYRNQ